MAVENTRDGRRFDRSYLVFGRMAELSGRSIIIGHEANFRPWAYKITTNKAINWIKKNSSERKRTIENIRDIPDKQKKDTGVKELLEKLDMRKKVVLCLYYFEQLSISEISVALKIPQGTVKSRLANARNELKDLYQQHFE